MKVEFCPARGHPGLASLHSIAARWMLSDDGAVLKVLHAGQSPPQEGAIVECPGFPPPGSPWPPGRTGRRPAPDGRGNGRPAATICKDVSGRMSFGYLGSPPPDRLTRSPHGSGRDPSLWPIRLKRVDPSGVRRSVRRKPPSQPVGRLRRNAASGLRNLFIRPVTVPRPNPGLDQDDR